MTAVLEAAVAQFPVGMDPAANLSFIAAMAEPLAPGALLVAPEGSLSGYLPEPGFVSRIDQAASERAIDGARRLAVRKQIHIVAGACVRDEGVWRNSSFYMGPREELRRYDKINLATSERGTFKAGDTLSIFNLAVEGGVIRLGVQMCREIRYPEQWRVLAEKGAEVIAYVNNAVGGPSGSGLWRAHLVSRAAEIERFILGANNAARDQTCPTMIVSPGGNVLAEVAVGAIGSAGATLNLRENSNRVLDQARRDIIAVTSKA